MLGGSCPILFFTRTNFFADSFLLHILLSWSGRMHACVRACVRARFLVSVCLRTFMLNCVRACAKKTAARKLCVRACVRVCKSCACRPVGGIMNHGPKRRPACTQFFSFFRRPEGARRFSHVATYLGPPRTLEHRKIPAKNAATRHLNAMGIAPKVVVLSFLQTLTLIFR